MSLSHVAVGCSLGNTFSAVAVSRAENSEVIANSDGHRTTPVAAAWGEESLSIGTPAIQGLASNAKNTALRFPQLLGANYADVSGDTDQYSCKVIDNDGQPALAPTDAADGVAPGDLVKDFLQFMWETAETNAGGETKEMVLAVPHGATAEYKEALKSASAAAGITVKDFISEPIAAAIGYGVGQGDTPVDQNVIVYDLGASKAVVTILQVVGGNYKVLSSVADTKLGGDVADALTVKMLAKEFKKSSKLDVGNDRKALAKLKQAAMEAKHILSSNANTTVAIESLFEGADFQMKLSRGKFDSTLASLYRKSAVPIEASLTAAGLKKDDVGQVLLVGGSSKASKVKKTLEMYFEREIVTDDVAPDEVIALGASRHGVQLANIEPDVVKDGPSLTAAAICVKSGDGLMVTIIPAKSLVPARVKLDLSVATEGQDSLALEVYEGTDAPKHLATATLNAVAAGARVAGLVEMLASGELKITLSSGERSVTGSAYSS